MKKDHPQVLLICLAFITSRAVFYLSGVRFDTSPLYQSAHFIDPFWLKNNLFECIFYLPSQPPLFNLFLGLVLKMFPQYYHAAFQWIFLATGLLFFIILYKLMIRLRVMPAFAMGLTLIFMINPAVIIYENWLFYTYFSGAWLCFAAFFLHRYLIAHKKRDGYVFFFLIAALALLKSTLHFVWFLGGLLIVLTHSPKRLKQVLVVSFIPLLILSFFYVKNLYLYGSFTLSKSWVGDQLLNIMFKDLSDEEVKSLYKEGKISVYSTTRRWSEQEKRELNLHEKFHQPISQIPPTGIAILDKLESPTKKGVTWHNRARLLISEHQVKDAFYVFRHYPMNFFKSMKRNYTVYFFPGPTDVTFKNRKPLERYENYYNFMFLHLNRINNGALYDKALKFWYHFDGLKWDFLSALLFACVVLMYLLGMCFGFFSLMVFCKNSGQNYAYRGVLFFVIFNIIFVTLVSNTLGWFGTNRYRFMLEPFYLILMGLMVSYYYKKRRRIP